MVPAGKTRSIKIVEGGYCPDTRRREKLQEKEAQYEALEEAFRCHGYNGTTQPPFVWRGGKERYTEDLFKPVSASMACMPLLGLAALTHIWFQKTRAIVPLLGGFDTV